MKSRASASAPGKIILFGEHFVVYGTSAILSSIDRRVKAEARTDDSARPSVHFTNQSALAGDKDAAALIHDAVTRAIGKRLLGVDITIHSDIPAGIGLGSSAAACVATIGAVQSLFEHPVREQVCRLAIESEGLVHKDSSGADCYVSTFGGLMRFSKTDGMRRLDAERLPAFIIANTGVPHSTGVMVSRVRGYRNDNQDRFDQMCKSSEQICSDAASALQVGDSKRLGELMNENQRLLDEIGVTHPKAAEIIKMAKSAGALGAKVTGAGGGGAVIVLARPEDQATVTDVIHKAGYLSFESKMGLQGLEMS